MKQSLSHLLLSWCTYVVLNQPAEAYKRTSDNMFLEEQEDDEEDEEEEEEEQEEEEQEEEELISV